MKKVGYILLQISGYLILLGGIADLTMSFFLDSLPEPHIKYLNINSTSVSFELKNLDYAFMRTIGGCLIAVGVGALTIIYTALKKNKGVLIALIGMVTIGEGINVSQMLLINSPYFIFPLVCIMFAWIGGLFWWIGNRN